MPAQPEPLERAMTKLINGRTPGGRELEIRDVSQMERLEPPPCPEGLEERGQLEWQKIWSAGPWLWPEMDYAWVEMVCHAYDDIAAFRKEIAAMGLTVEGYNGQTVANPLIAEVRRAEQAIAKALSEIGFSPSARARLKLADLKNLKMTKDLLNNPPPAAKSDEQESPVVTGYVEDSW